MYTLWTGGGCVHALGEIDAPAANVGQIVSITVAFCMASRTSASISLRSAVVANVVILKCRHKAILAAAHRLPL
jgi:hypothetical protein